MCRRNAVRAHDKYSRAHEEGRFAAMLSASGVLETLAWVAYGLASAASLRALKAGKASTAVQVAAALAFCAVDLYVPFTYATREHQVAVAVVLFLFPVVRPAKLVLYALGDGPLAAGRTLREHLVLSALPVIPLRCLPAGVRARMQQYGNTVKSGLHLLTACLSIVAGAVLLRWHAPAPSPTFHTRLGHMLAFVGFMVAVMDGAAALATAAGAGPVVRPFNAFWRATSLTDWWSYRWDTVVALTLRMSVFEPALAQIQRTSKYRPALKSAAGVATFALSAAIHEYSVEAQGHVWQRGQMTAYFLMQPGLIVLERCLHQAIEAACDAARVSSAAYRRVACRAVTIALVVAPVWYVWCPAYDPPMSDVNANVSRAVLQMVGLCGAMPHCG